MRPLGRLGIPCYAVSLRGHGNSWSPQYPHVLLAGKDTMVQDLALCIRKIMKGEDPEGGYVLVGHSAGGGLAQYLLAKADRMDIPAQCRGLVLMAAVPGTGS